MVSYWFPQGSDGYCRIPVVTPLNLSGKNIKKLSKFTRGSLLNQSEPYGNWTEPVTHFCGFQGAESNMNNGGLDALVGIPCTKEIELDL